MKIWGLDHRGGAALKQTSAQRWYSLEVGTSSNGYSHVEVKEQLAMSQEDHVRRDIHLKAGSSQDDQSRKLELLQWCCSESVFPWCEPAVA